MTKKWVYLLVFLHLSLFTSLFFVVQQLQSLKKNILMMNATSKSSVGDLTFIKNMQILEEKVKKHDENVAELAAVLAELSKQGLAHLDKSFVKMPQISLSQSLYTVTSSSDDILKVVGKKDLISEWQNQNAMFLNYIISRSLLVDYDKTKQRLEVVQVVPQSLFEQMGFVKGDYIENIDGRSFQKSAPLFEKLMDLNSKKIQLRRNNKKIILDVSYAAPNSTVLKLNLSTEQFNNMAPQMLANVHVMAVVSGSKEVGVKIDSVEKNTMLALLDLQQNDVITAINGEAVTAKNFSKNFLTGSRFLDIHYIRDQQKKIKVIELQ